MRSLRLGLIERPPLEVLIAPLLWGLAGGAIVDALAFVAGRPMASSGVAASTPLRLDLLALGDLLLVLLIAARLAPSEAARRALERLPRAPLLPRLLPVALALGLPLGAVLLRWLGIALGAEGRAAPLLVLERGAWDLLRAGLLGVLGLALVRCGRGPCLSALTLWALLRLTPLRLLDPLRLGGESPGLLWLAWGGSTLALSLVALRAGRLLRGAERAALAGRGGGFARSSLGLWQVTLTLALVPVLLRAEPLRPPVELPRRVVHVHTPLGVFSHDGLRPSASEELLGHTAEVASALRGELGPAPLGPLAGLESGPPSPGQPVELTPARLRAGTFGLAHERARARVLATLGSLVERDPAARVVAEGVALDVALRASGEDSFWALWPLAIAHARVNLSEDHLWSHEALREDLGPELAGAVGLAVCEELRARLGPEAPRELLAAWRRLPLPRAGSSGRQRWATALRDLGLDLGPLELWRAALGRAIRVRGDERADFPLPRLRVVLQLQDSPPGWQVLAQADAPIPPGWRVVCRTRGGLQDEPYEPRPLGLGIDDMPAFYVPTRDLSSSPWVQLGLAKADEPLLAAGVWEAWTPPLERRR